MKKAGILEGFASLLFLLAFPGAPGAWAHGEAKPGPHGGVIRMPGAFHTELKQEGPGRVRIYLLDVEWKNPITEGSSVQVALQRGQTESKLACKEKGDAFVCSLPKGERFRKGDELSVKASRKNEPGGVVKYAYPFVVGSSGGAGHGRHH